MRRAAGFTLIELVIVIVILAVLSAFALPRFADLGRDAQIAALEGLEGAMKSAASVTYSACQSSRNCDPSEVPTNQPSANEIILDGEAVTLAYGYPRAASSGILQAARIDPDDYQLENESSTTEDIALSPTGIESPSDCQLRYTEPNTAGSSPTITLTTAGC
ncbi:pilus assembly FimT family protein [Vreelandella utahensis]|uniref:pilus assembly FimT family protein n=1 Tax=Vreelandella halophila TaxID=86177 RepID=UPI0009853550|nr:type II secretion system protein [Halomonas utahensis]